MISPASPIASERPIDPAQVREGVQSLLERGYCVIPEALDPSERALATEVLDALVDSGQASEHDTWGYTIHPLASRDRRIAALYGHPTAVAIMQEIFDGDVQLKHTGSRVTDAHHTPRLPWHIHRPTGDDCSLQPGDPQRGERPRRLLCGFYVDGSLPESGPLIVLPRRFDDPLAPPSTDQNSPWPGEVSVTCPPGSAILFTTDVWHTAAAGTSGRRRRLFGAHFQGWGDPQPHREDLVEDGPEIEAAIAQNPVYARLMRRSAS